MDMRATYTTLRQNLQEGMELLALGEEDKDEDFITEGKKTLGATAKKAAKVRTHMLFTDPSDTCGAYVEIHAGAGGTESQDWANMLLRMYLRWAESKKYTTTFIGRNDGEEAGIKSAVIKAEGPYAFGWLKTEAGVHRLVRISPFDANARRHTSFASVWVYPVVDDSIHVEIEEKDVRTDTYRASGAGGQHVNTTDSAVRLTHIPTNITVQCQNERSQHKNKATAWNMLRARLYNLALQKRRSELEARQSAKADISWGNQIRSYVLQPYRQVKDLRTNMENPVPEKVLDGDLDDFMGATLAWLNQQTP